MLTIGPMICRVPSREAQASIGSSDRGRGRFRLYRTRLFGSDRRLVRERFIEVSIFASRMVLASSRQRHGEISRRRASPYGGAINSRLNLNVASHGDWNAPLVAQTTECLAAASS